MSMDYRLPNPNKKLAENLVRQFAERSVKGPDENTASKAENTLTVLRDNGDTYTVLVTVKDEKTGEVTQREKLFPDKHLRLLLKTVT